MDLPVASSQGMSVWICQLQAHRGCQCGFASCKLTGDVSVDLLVASSQGMSCGFASCKCTGDVSVDLL